MSTMGAILPTVTVRSGPRSPPPTLQRILYMLPLGLALFALALQFSGPQDPMDTDAFDLFNEQEYIRNAARMPKLETQLARHGGALRPPAAASRSPLPEGLGGQAWAWPGASSKTTEPPKIAFIVTTAESVEQIRLWMAYHRALGVYIYYLFVEGQAATPAAQEALAAEPGVTVIAPGPELEARRAASRIWNETWLSGFFNKPCNSELFVRQSLNMEAGIEMASRDHADWILHIDTDELLYPGGTRDFSLSELLSSVPSQVDVLVFPNYESLAESTDVEDPFSEVSLFKRSYSHVDSKVYFEMYGTVSRGNPNYFTTYGNGKAAARVRPGLRPNGAHRWQSRIKKVTEWTSEQAAVLHYTYNRFSDIRARRDRCDCKPTEEDAERCFLLPFDRLAFLEASLKDEAQLMEFFKARLVWDNATVVSNLINRGLFSRLYEPQLLVRGLKEGMRLQNEPSSFDGKSGGKVQRGQGSSGASATATAGAVESRAKAAVDDDDAPVGPGDKNKPTSQVTATMAAIAAKKARQEEGTLQGNGDGSSGATTTAAAG